MKDETLYELLREDVTTACKRAGVSDNPIIAKFFMLMGQKHWTEMSLDMLSTQRIFMMSESELLKSKIERNQECEISMLAAKDELE